MASAKRVAVAVAVVLIMLAVAVTTAVGGVGIIIALMCQHPAERTWVVERRVNAQPPNWGIGLT